MHAHANIKSNEISRSAVVGELVAWGLPSRAAGPRNPPTCRHMGSRAVSSTKTIRLVAHTVLGTLLTKGVDEMNWLYLGIAVIFEITVAISAGNAKGFTHPWWTIATLVSGAIATFFLSLALLTFSVGVGYAIWTSVAGVGIVVLGALFFEQPLSWRKVLGIVLVIGGVVGLRLSGAA
ncbi:MAG: multidrug efflux SMR transporter [Rhizobiaceae bacterium]|nr:multidrug efflux SMR transporter [Rhizobiaceae bacterium]